MCDENTVEENEAFLQRNVSRRAFTATTGAVAAAAAVAMVLPSAGRAAEAVSESDVTITTPDGEADCHFAHPAAGRHPGVVVWPDIVGLRPAFRDMGRRLASAGFAVLTVNPYYRKHKAPILPEGASFQDPSTRDVLMPLARSLDAETNVIDARAFVAWLDRQPAVDTRRGIGTTGYCMGGPMALRTAAAVADRVAACASFHGARLVTDQPDSPHLLVPRMKAQFLIAIADNDDEREPEAKNVLRAAFHQAGLPAEIEVYEGAMHGWCPPDSRVYDHDQAERAWDRLLALFGTALA